MSPRYLVITSTAVKSRPRRSGAFAAAGSGVVVRCLSRSRTPARLMLRITQGDPFVIDAFALVAELGGNPGNAVSTVRIEVHDPYPSREPSIGVRPGGPVTGR